MSSTKIEWCDKSWNPISGCGPDFQCYKRCWARRMAYRLKGRYGYPKDDPFRVIFHPDRLEEPLHWKKPSRIFVVSMGDLFHKDVSVIWLEKIFLVMVKAKWHKFFILTKRPEEAIKIGGWIKNLSNNADLMFGVSISTNKDLKMVETLLQIPAAKMFVSVEPILEDINLTKYLVPHLKGNGSMLYGSDWNKLDWVICGGETGPKARPMNPNWARSIRDQCQGVGVPFFFKSMGDFERNKTKCPCGCRRKKLPENLIPSDLMIREFPK